MKVLSLLMIVLIALLAIPAIATHAPPDVAMSEISFETLTATAMPVVTGIEPGTLVLTSAEMPVLMIKDGGLFNLLYSHNACRLNRLLTVAVSDDFARHNGWFANIGYI